MLEQIPEVEATGRDHNRPRPQQAETTVIASASAICTSVHPPSDRTPFFGPLMMRALVGLLSSNGASTRWPPGLPDSPGLKPRPVTPPLLVALSLLRTVRTGPSIAAHADHATATSRSPHAPTAPRRRRTRPSHSRSPSLARAPCSAPRRRPRSSSATTTKREPAGPRISSSDRTAEGDPEQQQRCDNDNGWSQTDSNWAPLAFSGRR